MGKWISLDSWKPRNTGSIYASANQGLARDVSQLWAPVAFATQQCQLPLKRRKGKAGISLGMRGLSGLQSSLSWPGGKPLIPADIHPCPTTANKGILQLREGKRGKFWGCSRYPLCLTLLNDAKINQPEAAHENENRLFIYGSCQTLVARPKGN